MTLEEMDTKITESVKHLRMGEGVWPTEAKVDGAAHGHPRGRSSGYSPQWIWGWRKRNMQQLWDTLLPARIATRRFCKALLYKWLWIFWQSLEITDIYTSNEMNCLFFFFKCVDRKLLFSKTGIGKALFLVMDSSRAGTGVWGGGQIGRVPCTPGVCWEMQTPHDSWVQDRGLEPGIWRQCTGQKSNQKEPQSSWTLWKCLFVCQHDWLPAILQALQVVTAPDNPFGNCS